MAREAKAKQQINSSVMASATILEQSRYGSSRREHNHHHHQETAAADLSLREWGLRSRVSRENTRSRRFSGSYITSFREDNATSFRSNFTISSTASSPGYPLKDEIDPSTYSFTTALKALQAKAGYGNNSWECSSPDGFALNSKWNEAEKYICNPLSGQVPMECLSAKTLSGRISFLNSTTNRITMSAPLVYSSSSSSSYSSRPVIFTKPTSISATPDHPHHVPLQTQEKKTEGLMMTTRDVGTQSTPQYEMSSSSPSPASTPPIIERCLKRCDLGEGGDSPHCNNGGLNLQLKVNKNDETRGKEEAIKVESGEEKKKKKENEQIWICSSSSSSRRSMQSGCLSWMRKRQREKHKPPKRNNFLLHLEGC